jgi:hypothetical protein
MLASGDIVELFLKVGAQDMAPSHLGSVVYWELVAWRKKGWTLLVDSNYGEVNNGWVADLIYQLRS